MEGFSGYGCGNRPSRLHRSVFGGPEAANARFRGETAAASAPAGPVRQIPDTLLPCHCKCGWAIIRFEKPGSGAARRQRPALARGQGNLPRHLAMRVLRTLADPAVSRVTPDLLLLAVQKLARRRQFVNVRGRSLQMARQTPGVGADETVKASAFRGRFFIVPDGGVRVRIGPVTAKEPDIWHLGRFAGADTASPP